MNRRSGIIGQPVNIDLGTKEVKQIKYVLEWFDISTTGWTSQLVNAKAVLIQSDIPVDIGIDQPSPALRAVTEIFLKLPVGTLYLQRRNEANFNGRILITAYRDPDFIETRETDVLKCIDRMANSDLTWDALSASKIQDFDFATATGIQMRHIYITRLSWKRSQGTVDRLQVYEGNANHAFVDIYLDVAREQGHEDFNPPVTCICNNYGEAIPALTFAYLGSVEDVATTLYIKMNYKFD